jgi:hypothetical protein
MSTTCLNPPQEQAMDTTVEMASPVTPQAANIRPPNGPEGAAQPNTSAPEGRPLKSKATWYENCPEELAEKVYALLREEWRAEKEQRGQEAQLTQALAGLNESARQLVDMIETAATLYPCEQVPAGRVIDLSRTVLGLAANQVASRTSLEASLAQLRRQRETRRSGLIEEMLAALCTSSLRTRAAVGTFS